MKSKITFVILHYKTIDETIKCVESIFSITRNENFEIVIVDNGSNNDSNILLKEKYSNNKKVHLIINKENLGFARGNNIGFKYAKNNKSDFIVLTNNDIIFTQSDFCNLIEQEYKKYNYAVLGPKILMPSGDTTVFNPSVKNITSQKIYIFLLYFRLLITYLNLGFIFNSIYNFKSKRRKKKINIDECKIDVPVYGCCMIFSKKYIDKFDGIDDRTFLYCEEDLLYLRLKKKNMIELYDPKLEVLHNHSVTTNSIFKSKKKKDIFVIKNLIKSNKILLQELKN